MTTLKTQYANYLKENPNVGYDEWLNILSDKLSTIIKQDEPRVSDNFQIGPDGAFEYSEREIDFKNILYSMGLIINRVDYINGDISDIGNEIGIATGSLIPNMTEDEISMFISGFKHGVSLTNGTH